MKAQTDEAPTPATVGKLPLWLLALGVVPFIGTAMLAGRLIWEQTVWTWEGGPQMVGFSLVHGSGATLLIFPPILIAWAIAVTAVVVARLIRKRRISWTSWLALGLPILILVMMSLPEGFWERVFIRQMANSHRAGDLVVYAAYRGDLGTVRATLSHGVPVDITEHSQWRTPLHAAAIAGDLSLVQFLVSKGADVNSRDRSGDSPVELAQSNGRTECASFLEKQGGKRIKGDEAQRQKAIHDEVSEDINEMERTRPR